MMQEFVQQVKNIIDDMVSGIHTAMPATIISFDPGTCTATILPRGQITDNKGKKINYPQVSGVPVVFIQSAGQIATIAYPVKPGDGCLFVVAERSLDYWMFGQETSTVLKFDLSNGIAIPGLFVAGNQVIQEACDQDAIIIDNAGGRIAVTQGRIAISGNIYVDGNLSVEGNLSIGGDFSTAGRINASGDVTGYSNLSINGNISAAGRIDASGDVTGDGNLSIGGDFSTAGRINASGDITGYSNLSINGNISAAGRIDASGDVTGDGTSLHTHTHGGVTSGTGSTSEPN